MLQAIYCKIRSWYLSKSPPLHYRRPQLLEWQLLGCYSWQHWDGQKTNGKDHLQRYDCHFSGPANHYRSVRTSIWSILWALWWVTTHFKASILGLAVWLSKRPPQVLGKFWLKCPWVLAQNFTLEQVVCIISKFGQAFLFQYPMRLRFHCIRPYSYCFRIKIESYFNKLVRTEASISQRQF